MAIGVQIIKILAGESFSEPIILPWASNTGIAYIATEDAIVANTKLELWVQSKKTPTTFFPFYDTSISANANIPIVQNKLIPCSPYVDGRGSESIKFKINTIQGNDVYLEVGLTKFI